MKKSELRTPLARVRGMGSAKDGTSHFIWQRLTAILLLPLTFWFIYSLMHMVINTNPHAVSLWFQNSLHATALIVMLAALFYHSKLGLQVIIEDYVHAAFPKYTCLLLNMILMYGFAAVSILATLKLHLFAGSGE